LQGQSTRLDNDLTDRTFTLFTKLSLVARITITVIAAAVTKSRRPNRSRSRGDCGRQHGVTPPLPCLPSKMYDSPTCDVALIWFESSGIPKNSSKHVKSLTPCGKISMVFTYQLIDPLLILLLFYLASASYFYSERSCLSVTQWHRCHLVKLKLNIQTRLFSIFYS